MITSEYGDCDEDYVDTSLGLHFPRLQFDDEIVQFTCVHCHSV